MPSDVLYTQLNALIFQNKNGGGGPITYQFLYCVILCTSVIMALFTMQHTFFVQIVHCLQYKHAYYPLVLAKIIRNKVLVHYIDLTCTHQDINRPD